MTEKLYYNDAYIKDFCATVIACEPIDGEYKVVLDKTAFFPKEGGQYADTGYIADAFVSDAFEKDGVIYHITDKELKEGSEVECKLNFDERFDKMQQHSAEHIISGIVNDLFTYQNVGFHLGADIVTLDFDKPLSKDELARVEYLANEAIWANKSVKAYFPSADELSTINYRSKLDLKENVRIVEIDGVDICACCAPHVSHTGEIGIIKLLFAEKHRGGMRIYMAAGRRAYKDYFNKHNDIESISVLLSEKRENVVSGVSALKEKLEGLKEEIKLASISESESIANTLDATEGNLVYCFKDNYDVDAMLAFANIAKKKVGGYLVLLTSVEGKYKYMIVRDGLDISSHAKEINTALYGRGGGRGEMIRGTFEADLESIKQYFKNKKDC